MVLSIRDFLKENIPQGSDDLSQMHDQIEMLETLEKINQITSPQLFTVYAGIKFIGNWQSDGWHGIIINNAELIPYLPQSLGKLGLVHIKNELQKITSYFS